MSTYNELDSICCNFICFFVHYLVYYIWKWKKTLSNIHMFALLRVDSKFISRSISSIHEQKNETISWKMSLFSVWNVLKGIFDCLHLESDWIENKKRRNNIHYVGMLILPFLPILLINPLIFFSIFHFRRFWCRHIRTHLLLQKKIIVWMTTTTQLKRLNFPSSNCSWMRIRVSDEFVFFFLTNFIFLRNFMFQVIKKGF